MKHLLLMILVTMFSVSCSDDNDDNDMNPLVGKWVSTDVIEGFEFSWELTFKDNSTGTLVVITNEMGETYSDSTNFTWTAENNKLTMSWSDYTEIINYSVTNNKLTIELGDEGIVNFLVLTRI